MLLSLFGEGPRCGERRPRALLDLHPDSPRRAREAEVRDLGEPELVLAQREQQVGDPVGRRQLSRLGDADAPAVDPPPARAEAVGALLADEPDADAARAAAPVRSRASRSRSSWPTRSPSSPSATRSAPGSAPASPRGAALTAERDHLARAAPRLDPRDRPGVDEADRRRRERQRLDHEQRDARQAEQDDDPEGPRRPAAAGAAQRALGRLAAPVKPRRLLEAPRRRGPRLERRRRSGSAPALTRSAAGDRPPHDDELGVERQLPDDLRRAVRVRDRRDHPAVELGAERLDRRLLAAGRPSSTRRAWCGPCGPS